MKYGSGIGMGRKEKAGMMKSKPKRGSRAMTNKKTKPKRMK